MTKCVNPNCLNQYEEFKRAQEAHIGMIGQQASIIMTLAGWLIEADVAEGCGGFSNATVYDVIRKAEDAVSDKWKGM